MDASTTLPRSARYVAGAPLAARLASVAAWTVLALLALGGALVCIRRISGALREPLSPAMLVALGLALAAATLVIRRFLARDSLSRAAAYAAWATPSLVLALWAGGVSLGESNALGLAAMLGALLLEEGWSWGRFQSPAVAPQVESPAATSRPALSLAPESLLEVAADDEPAADVTQQITRRGDASGETLEGLVRVDFVTGQRHGVAHVAICPPMLRVPECHAEQADGPPARLKIGEVQAYGVRFELRLDQPAEEPASVWIEFSIQESATDSAAPQRRADWS